MSDLSFRVSSVELRAPDCRLTTLPIGPKVVPFWGSYLEFYEGILKRNYFGAYGLWVE